MNATMRFIVWGTIPLGAIVGGALGDIIGLHETIWVGAIGGLLAFLPVALSSVREIVDDARAGRRRRAARGAGRASPASGRARSAGSSRIGMRMPRSRATSIARS